MLTCTSTSLSSRLSSTISSGESNGHLPESERQDGSGGDQSSRPLVGDALTRVVRKVPLRRLIKDVADGLGDLGKILWLRLKVAGRGRSPIKVTSRRTSVVGVSSALSWKLPLRMNRFVVLADATYQSYASSQRTCSRNRCCTRCLPVPPTQCSGMRRAAPRLPSDAFRPSLSW